MLKKILRIVNTFLVCTMVILFTASCSYGDSVAHTPEATDAVSLNDSAVYTAVGFQNMTASCDEYRVAVVDGGDLWNWVADIETGYGNDLFYKKFDEKSVSIKPQKINGIHGVVSVSLDCSNYKGIAVKTDGSVWIWDFYKDDIYAVSNIEKLEDISDAKYALMLDFSTISLGGDYSLYGLCIITHGGEIIFNTYSYFDNAYYDDNGNYNDIIPNIKVQRIPKNEKIKYISACNGSARFAIAVLESGGIAVLNYNYSTNMLEFHIIENCRNVFYVQNPVVFFTSGDIGYVKWYWKDDECLYTVEPAENNNGAKFFADYGFINTQGDIFDYNLTQQYANVSDAIFFTKELIITAKGEVYELVDGQKENENFSTNHYRPVLINARALKVDIPNIYIKHFIDNLPKKVNILIGGEYDPIGHFAEIYSQ